VFVVLNLFTAERFPVPWQDEVMFTDVAANYAAGDGFTSSVWTCGRPIESFWSCNAPLYPYLLGNWIRIFGFSIVSVRSLNYALIAASAGLLWLATRRLKLISAAPMRILFVILILTDYGIGINYRSARYDCLAILLASAMFLSFSIKGLLRRCVLLSAIGVIFPLAGIQLIPFAFLFSGLLLLFFRYVYWREIVAALAGTCVGVLVLLFIFAQQDALGGFLATLHAESASALAKKVADQTIGERLPKDPSLFVLFIGTGIFLLGQKVSGTWQFKSITTFGFIAALLVPAGMFVAGKFPTYYSWMAYIPLCLGTCAALATTSNGSRISLRNGLALGVLCSILVGLPLQLASAAYYWHDRDYGLVEALVARHVKMDDWVYAEYGAYFAVKAKSKHVFVPFVIPEEYRKKIDIMILAPGAMDTYARAIIGGEWVDTGDELGSSKGDVVNNRFAALLQRRYDLKVYRRAPIAGKSASPLEND
jgi:MFS family permease